MSKMANKKPTPRRKPTGKRAEQARRRFLRSMALGTGVAAASLLGFVPVLTQSRPRLRPPGALDEQEFLAACIKCGQCVQVCPVSAIRLAHLDEGFGMGVPYIVARDQACDFSCDGLQCVLACPTGALDHHLDYPHQSTMGLARVARPDKCLAIQGKGWKGPARGGDFTGILRFDEIDRWNPLPVTSQPFDLEICDLCVRLCPIEKRANQCDAGKPPSGDVNQCPPKRAIRLVSMGDGPRMRPEVLEGCVGCGVCEMVCPTEPAAIVIDEQKQWGAA